MSSVVYVLLPPSESKEPGGRHTTSPGFFDEALDASRAKVRDALATLLSQASSDEVSKVLKVRGALLERALHATRQLVERRAPVMPAWQRYSGVVWSHLDPGSLKDRQRRRILVPSGLYGLSSATDLISDYRLTMKVALPGLGNVASFWRPTLADVLEQMEGGRFVNLLPQEHHGAIDHREGLASRVIDVTFRRAGGDGVAGHDAKAVKGIVARRILDEGIDAIDGLRWGSWRGRIREGHYEVRDTSRR
ncbi:MAG: YaaA family protein [Acidobacteria bacterium]|nr:YaaA family protein [Acidobacteriota bacterium]